MSFFLKKRAKVRTNSFQIPREASTSVGLSTVGYGSISLWYAKKRRKRPARADIVTDHAKGMFPPLDVSSTPARTTSSPVPVIMATR